MTFILLKLSWKVVLTANGNAWGTLSARALAGDWQLCAKKVNREGQAPPSRHPGLRTTALLINFLRRWRRSGFQGFCVDRQGLGSSDLRQIKIIPPFTPYLSTRDRTRWT
jgi:hypothetical protein